jgi:Cu+-exporting ATPase
MLAPLLHTWNLNLGYARRLVGECLEAWTFARTQNALGKLAELFPNRCWVLRDGAEVGRTVTSIAVE